MVSNSYDQMRDEMMSLGASDSYWLDRFCNLVSYFEAEGHLLQESDFYDNLVTLLFAMTKCDVASISLLVAGEKDFVMVSHAGEMHPDAAVEYASVSSEVGRMPFILSTHEPILLDFVNPHERDLILRQEEILDHQCAVTVPILFEGSVLGMFNVGYHESFDWNGPKVRYLSMLGRVMGALINRETTRRKLFELQFLEETRRMSAEIHDNLAQAIYAARLEADKASVSFESGDYEMLEKDLRGVENACQIAADLIRDELISLRAMTEPAESLAKGIERMVEQFRCQWGIAATLEMSGILEETSVSSRVQMHILRILHEGLCNVIRHSKADSVAVRLECDGLDLLLLVHDNGCGFAVDEVSSDHLGIRIMDERAKAVEGSFAIDSKRGEGTTIRVRVPRFY